MDGNLTRAYTEPLISHPMSVNAGRNAGQVVHPGLAPDRKQKRSSTSRLPVPAGDVIEISSDEDEEPQPPRKRTLTERGRPPPAHEPDYKALLVQKDQEIERRKKVRRRRHPRGWFGLILHCEEGDRVGANCCGSEDGNRGKEDSRRSCASNP